MRDIKPELVDAAKHNVVILQNIPQHQGLVKANRFLLSLVFMLIIMVFTLGFFLIPSNNILDNIKAGHNQNASAYKIQNPVLSAEIDSLKSQFVGLISGSIESKLRALEQSVRSGSINLSLGTIEDLRNDVHVLRTYSEPKKQVTKNEVNQALLQEVSQLKTLIYLTLSSCGLMVAAIGGFWIRNRFRLEDNGERYKAMLGNKRE